MVELVEFFFKKSDCELVLRCIVISQTTLSMYFLYCFGVYSECIISTDTYTLSIVKQYCSHFVQPANAYCSGSTDKSAASHKVKVSENCPVNSGVSRDIPVIYHRNFLSRTALEYHYKNKTQFSVVDIE
jgi:hypothetical protein